MAVLCWGTNGHGQAGTGFKGSNRYSPIVACLAPSPVKQVITTYYMTAVLAGEDVWTWGGNEGCGCGDGTHEEKLHPVKVLGGVRQIAAGGQHVLALMKDGTVWTWGGNSYGQNGIPELAPAKGGEERSVISPTPIPNLTGVVGVAAGGAVSMARKVDGSVWTWGENVHGELGMGFTSPMGIAPLPIAGLGDARMIACGGQSTHGGHILILRATGELLAAGKNNQGQLGDGTTTNRPWLTPVQLPGPVTAMSAAAGHSLFVKNGIAYGCGSNEHGELGEPDFGERSVVPQVIMRAEGARAGWRYSLFRAGSQAFACGSNYYGCIGDGSEADKPTPTLLPLAGVKAIAAGEFVSCALADPAPSPTITVTPGIEPGSVNVAWTCLPSEESGEPWTVRGRKAYKPFGTFGPHVLAADGSPLNPETRSCVLAGLPAGEDVEVEVQTHAFKAQVALGTAA